MSEQINQHQIINFGWPSNGQVCSCGKHHGIGPHTPERRAAMYARQRDQLFAYYLPHQRDYVNSWEQEHGKIIWGLVQEFNKKNEPYMAANFEGNRPKPELNPEPQARRPYVE